eukprot:1149497-Pelagomonas_calceolata.AAC.1
MSLADDCPQLTEPLIKQLYPTSSMHYALALPEYTHFTSPIRRYALSTVWKLASEIESTLEQMSLALLRGNVQDLWRVAYAGIQPGCTGNALCMHNRWSVQYNQDAGSALRMH